jgi:phthiocerol/phenolphthiocerol synthesis type-I polyketide synthase E
VSDSRSGEAAVDHERVPGMDIAVIGMSCIFPGADEPDAFWRNIVTGVESLTDLSEEDLRGAGEDPELIRTPEYVRRAACIDNVDLFDAEFFGINPREAERTDPQRRLFLEHCWRAIENAGYDPRRIPGPVGVYAGQSINTYIRSVRSHVDWGEAARTGERWENVGALENDLDYLAPKVSYHLGLTGPSIPLGTACSTSLVAVHMACQALRTFECDAALAGGVAITLPAKRGYLYLEGGIASADGHTRTFDARSTGTVFGSGVGVVLLKRMEDALADRDNIAGVIVGSAINNDGAARAGFSTPSVNGQAEVIAQAQAVAGVHPDTITYLEAHGTGTPVGDPIEVAALTRAFREYTDRCGYCVIGSVKANIGHMDAAAGVAGLIKALYAVTEGVIPPQLNFSEPNQALRLDESPFRVAIRREPWRTVDNVPRRAGVSSFGIGGTNAHVVVEQPPVTERDQETGGWYVLPVSARDDKALSDALGRLADTLENGLVRLDDTAFTLQHGRTRFGRRAAVTAPDRVTAVRALRERRERPFTDGRPETSTAFLFPGQGAHFPGMASGLYNVDPEFTAAFDRCAELFLPLLDHDLRDLVLKSSATPRPALLGRSRFIQPALFSVEYSLARTLIAYGAKPSAMLGHSLGEFAAATIAEVFTLGNAVRVVDARARFMDEAPSGAMLSVPLPECELLLPDGVTVAAYNGPRLVTLAGPHVLLDKVKETLGKSGVTCRSLRVPHAMHSVAMAAPAARFATFMETVPVGAPAIPFISNVTGTWIAEEEIRSPRYWGSQMREPIQFERGLANLLSRTDGSLVETGPGRSMLSLAQAAQPARLVQTLSSASDGRNDLEVLHEAFAALWESGTELSWSVFARQGRRTTLPTYPFQRKRYWTDPASDRPAEKPGAMPRVRDPEGWFYSPAWRSSAGPRVPSSLTGMTSTVILVGAATEFTQAMADRMTAAGRVVTQVGFAQGANVGVELRHALDGAANAAVVFTSAVDDRADADAERAAQLLAVARMLAECDSARLDLLVLTVGAFDVSGTEPIIPGHAILAGIGKVIQKELSHVACRVMDLELTSGPAQTADDVLRELDQASCDPVSAYRGGRRWIQDVEQLQITAAMAQDAPLREKGVYLITGGLGGIGLSLGYFLGRKYGARLVLSGRTAPPDPAQWDDWISRHGPEDQVSRQIIKLRDIKAAGGEVIAVSCDMTALAAVHALVKDTVERFGTLNGVVHSAGHNGSGSGSLIEAMEFKEFEETLAPEIIGAQALVKATKDAGLDFLALFSSLSTLDSEDGAADCAPGSAYLDALAHHARRQGRADVMAIDFSQHLTEAERHAAFTSAISTGLSRVHVSVHDLNHVLHQARQFARGAAPRGADPGVPSRGLSSSAGDRDELGAPLDAELTGIFRRVLGAEHIGRTDSFFALGGNSLLALDLIAQVRRDYQVKIPLRDFFSVPTIQGLASLVGTARPREQVAPSGEHAGD